MVKKFEELTFHDDYMFCAVMKNKEHCKRFLEVILGIDIRDIEYTESQKYIDSDSNSKTIRLDVYVNDDEGTVYDLEMQNGKIIYLPKRLRYYQGNIDLGLLSQGERYEDLRKTVIIFICRYNPFEKQGVNLPVYTFKSLCVENTSVVLEDDTTKIVINTKGDMSDTSDEFKHLMKFIDSGIAEDGFTNQLNNEVVNIRHNQKRRLEYMTLERKFYEIESEARAEGRAEGKNEGIMEGRIKALYYDAEFEVPEIAAKTGIDEDTIKAILKESPQ